MTDVENCFPVFSNVPNFQKLDLDLISIFNNFCLPMDPTETPNTKANTQSLKIETINKLSERMKKSNPMTIMVSPSSQNQSPNLSPVGDVVDYKFVESPKNEEDNFQSEDLIRNFNSDPSLNVSSLEKENSFTSLLKKTFSMQGITKKENERKGQRKKKNFQNLTSEEENFEKDVIPQPRRPSAEKVFKKFGSISFSPVNSPRKATTSKFSSFLNFKVSSPFSSPKVSPRSGHEEVSSPKNSSKSVSSSNSNEITNGTSGTTSPFHYTLKKGNSIFVEPSIHQPPSPKSSRSNPSSTDSPRHSLFHKRSPVNTTPKSGGVSRSRTPKNQSPQISPRSSGVTKPTRSFFQQVKDKLLNLQEKKGEENENQIVTLQGNGINSFEETIWKLGL
jgi:hypothetical protein